MNYVQNLTLEDPLKERNVRGNPAYRCACSWAVRLCGVNARVECVCVCVCMRACVRASVCVGDQVAAKNLTCVCSYFLSFPFSSFLLCRYIVYLSLHCLTRCKRKIK